MLGRRSFSRLGVAALFAGPAAIASGGEEASGDALAAIAYSLFPHDPPEAQRYGRAAAAYRSANGPAAQRLTDAVGGAAFLDLGRAQRVALLETLARTPEFLGFRFHVMTSLYGDLTLTRQFGYEGPSLEHGGYLHRGFGDIDWLPEPESQGG